MLHGIYVNILLYKDLRFACGREVKWRHCFFFREKYHTRWNSHSQEILLSSCAFNKRNSGLVLYVLWSFSVLKLLQGDSFLRLFKHWKYCAKRSDQEKNSEERERARRSLLCPSPYLPFFALRSSLNSRHSSLFEHLHNRLIEACIPNRTRTWCKDGFCCIHEILLRQFLHSF